MVPCGIESSARRATLALAIEQEVYQRIKARFRDVWILSKVPCAIEVSAGPPAFFGAAPQIVLDGNLTGDGDIRIVCEIPVSVEQPRLLKQLASEADVWPTDDVSVATGLMGSAAA